MIEKELNNLFQSIISKNYFQGIQWIIQKHEKLYKGKVGLMDLKTKEDIRENTIYRIWSMTKPIIALATIILLEKNKIKLEDPIEKYLNSAKNLKVLNKDNDKLNLTKLKRSITIKDLLMHTAGFSYNFLDDPIGKEYEKSKLFHSDETSLKSEVEKILLFPLLFQPGENWNYSVSIDILARIIEVISDQDIYTFLNKHIFKPLNMNETNFYVGNSERHRIMTSYEFIKESNTLLKVRNSPNKINNYGYPFSNKKYSRGGHGLFTTISDYMKFALMLQSGKTQNGDILVSENYLKKINQNYLDNKFLPLEINSIGDYKYKEFPNDLIPYGWGLGFRVMNDIKLNNNIGSIGEFGWSGAAATYFLVDPKKKITAVLMTQVLHAHPVLKKTFYNYIYNNL